MAKENKENSNPYVTIPVSLAGVYIGIVAVV